MTETQQSDTREKRYARLALISYRHWTDSRDRLITHARKVGIPKMEIFRLTGVARSTIDTILAKEEAIDDNDSQDKRINPGVQPAMDGGNAYPQLEK